MENFGEVFKKYCFDDEVEDKCELPRNTANFAEEKIGIDCESKCTETVASDPEADIKHETINHFGDIVNVDTATVLLRPYQEKGAGEVHVCVSPNAENSEGHIDNFIKVDTAVDALETNSIQIPVNGEERQKIDTLNIERLEETHTDMNLETDTEEVMNAPNPSVEGSVYIQTACKLAKTDDDIEVIIDIDAVEKRENCDDLLTVENETERIIKRKTLQKRRGPKTRNPVKKSQKLTERKKHQVKREVKKTYRKKYTRTKTEKIKKVGNHRSNDFICDKCGNRSRHSVSFWRHKRQCTKTDSESDCGVTAVKFLCDYCGKDIKEKQELKLHIMRLHTSERPYKCDIENCKKAFLTATLLKIHKDTVHFNVRRYKCSECDQTFKRKPSLNVHMQNQHVVAGQKMCPTCGEYFNQKINLDFHIKAHSDPSILICKICAKKYRNKSSLDKHYKTHTSSLQCDVCGEEFSRKKYLLEHQWKHTGMYKHVQCICLFSFLFIALQV